jgi:hypothetical protein
MFGRSRNTEMCRIEAKERTKVAQDLAVQALAMAQQARAMDLPALAYLLETAALEASTEAGFGHVPDQQN